MTAQTEAKVHFGFWGFVAGAGLAMIVGFNWGGWTTSSASQKMSDEAVMASRATICAAQFMSTDRKVRIKQYQELDSYQRSELIEKAGWDRMPGEEKANWGVASACVGQIDALMKGMTL